MDDDLSIEGVPRGAGLGLLLWLLMASLGILLRRALGRQSGPLPGPRQ